MTKVPPAFWLDPEGDGVPDEPLPPTPDESGQRPDGGDRELPAPDDAPDDRDPDASDDRP